MENLEFSVLKEAKQGISELDAARRDVGLSYAAISRKSEMPDTGQQYYRMTRSKDVKLSKYLKFADAVGCDVVLVKRREAEG